MNKLKSIFCLFLIFISFVYINDIKKINVLKVITSDNKVNVIKTFTDKSFKDPISFLDIKNGDSTPVVRINKEINKELNSDPIVYIFNTHQTEEYLTNVYNITPTVMTVSNILQDELKNYNINSFVETKDIIKEVKKRGLDYPGTYEVSLDYLKEREKQFPSLTYFFDMLNFLHFFNIFFLTLMTLVTL